MKIVLWIVVLVGVVVSAVVGAVVFGLRSFDRRVQAETDTLVVEAEAT